MNRTISAEEEKRIRIPLLTLTRSSGSFDIDPSSFSSSEDWTSSEDDKDSDFDASKLKKEWSRPTSSNKSSSSTSARVTRLLGRSRRKNRFLFRFALPLTLLSLIIVPILYLLLLLLHTPTLPSSPSLPLLQRHYNALLHNSTTQDNSTFSLLIPTFRRPTLLFHNLQLYANGSIPSLSDIYIIWGSPSLQDPPPSFETLAREHNWPVRLHLILGPPERSLSSRFLPPESLNTSVVLSIDDDLTIPPEEIERGFQNFQNLSLMEEISLAGWSQRSHSTDLLNGDWKYLSPFLSWMTGRYSMILTNQAFIRTPLLYTYNHPILTPLREFVDRNTNCEDILMSMLSSWISGPPALMGFEGTIVHWRKGGGEGKGISEGKGHYEMRTRCLERFSGFFGTKALEFRRKTLWEGQWVNGVKAPRIDQGRVWEEEIGQEVF